MTDEVKDLSNIYGFVRLFSTLTRDGSNKRNTSDMLYGCYLSNMDAYNERYGADLEPLEPSIFYYKMTTSRQRPYKTEIQTIKALTLLDWNISEKPEFAKAAYGLRETLSSYSTIFRHEQGYPPRDAVTSFSLCEETLDPEHEPEYEINPGVMLRKHDTGAKLVYICAPLRGDVEDNIEFARQKAKEVFAEGNIPICPHLMFPPIADPANPAEDKAAMDMCLKLIDRCNEIRIFGGEWTEGMWQEIRHAERMKIPVKTDQTEIPRNKPHTKQSPCR